MPELQAARGADSSESAATWLLDQLAAWASERVVVTLFASGDPLVVSHACVLLGPTGMANRSWPDWAASEGELTHDTWRGGPARFAISVGSCQLARASLTQRQARAWLAGAIAGRAPAIAGLPAADMQVDTERARYTAMMRKGKCELGIKVRFGCGPSGGGVPHPPGVHASGRRCEYRNWRRSGASFHPSRDRRSRCKQPIGRARCAGSGSRATEPASMDRWLAIPAGRAVQRATPSRARRR